MNNILQEQSLERFVIFGGLTERERIEIMPFISQRDFTAGELVFAEGDRSDEIFLVYSGMFEITVRSGKEEISVASFSEGDIIGEMAFFDQHPRSAACRARAIGQVLIITTETFELFKVEYPHVYSGILRSFYNIITDRLLSSDSFLSDMVQWGEKARKRSITDPATGLFNRRYFDDFLDATIFDANSHGSNFIMIMMDIDKFGAINRDFGTALADECIVAFGEAIKGSLRDQDTAARYGGDEFIAVLPQTTVKQATVLCTRLRAELARQMKNGGVRLSRIPLTISQGIACFPVHAHAKEDIFAVADAALYVAKEKGGGGGVVFDPATSNIAIDRSIHFRPIPPDRSKSDIPSIAQRNRVINNIINAILHQESFIVLGHINCDEDCFAAGMACALLLKRFQKDVTLCVHPPVSAKAQLLHDICAYNKIALLSPQSSNLPECSVVIICDTAKPDLLDAGPAVKALISDTSILKIEIDHHLGADSRYIGSDGYCLVQRSSSTCEIVLLLCLKLRQQREPLRQLHIKSLITRNIALALAIGIITDTHNGRILNNKRDKRLFDAIIHLLDRWFTNNTFDNSKINSITDIMQLNDELSLNEVSLKKYFKRRVKHTPCLHYVVLYEAESSHLSSVFEYSSVQNVSRVIADQLAEESGFFGLTGYIAFGIGGVEQPLMQCRIRRNLRYPGLDLRTILGLCSVQDGGGHEGAVGFRFPYANQQHATEYIMLVVETLHDQWKLASAPSQ